jgi:transcriptional regulator with XRE-family HTH domain
MTPQEFKQARSDLGLTGEQAAAMLGYGSKVRISEIENGARTPSAAVTRLLQAYLDGHRPADWPISSKHGR